MAGRRAKTEKDRKLSGNPGNRKNENLGDFEVSNHDWLEPPIYIQDDPLALKEWERLCPILSEAGILHPLDLNTVGAYCTIISLYQRTKKLIQEQGPLLEDK